MAGMPIVEAEQETTWSAPKEASTIVNPTEVLDEDNLEIGGELFMQYCKMCHGKKGLGDGPQSSNMQLKPGNLASQKVQDQTDGELFWKISTGRGLMPKFEKKIRDEEDRWLIVNYVRTLAKK